MDWPRIKALFGEAVSLEDAAREAYLADLAAQDPALAEALRDLLDVSQERLDRIEAHTLPTGHVPGEQLGPYTIERLLGSGGMGHVYLAHQQAPHPRRVALKIAAGLLPDARARLRFQREQAILAQLNHSHIAALYQVGTTSQGAPYIAMEYVDGAPITAFADSRGLSLSDRLELFLGVCAAVGHAHVHGIIHRDLKPTNILVTVQDGRPHPKVIDFGIARHVEAATRHTATGAAPGTPLYMAPEQLGLTDAEGAPLVPDFRADVYALGVVLYELVVGVLPYAFVDVRPSWAAVNQAVIQGARPPLRAFDRLTPEARTRLATERGETCAGMRRQLGGDLGRVLEKALAPQPDARYATPVALADDLGRYLRHLPVTATPPDISYVLGRFIKRRRAAVLAVLTALCLLPAFTVFTLHQNSRIRAERNRAADESRRARLETATTRRVTDFLISLFEAADPVNPGDVTAGTLLDRGAEALERDLEADPRIRGRLQATLGRVFMRMGRPQEGYRLLEQAVTLLEGSESDAQDDLYLARIHLGECLFEVGDLEASRDTLEALIRDVRPHPEAVDHLAAALNAQGIVWKELQHMEEAERVYRESLDLRLASVGEEDPNTAGTLQNLAAVLRHTGRLDEAETLYRRSLAIRRRIHPHHADTAYSLNGLAMLLLQKKAFAEAETLLLEALDVRRKTLGPDHPLTATSLNNLGGLRYSQGDYVASLPYFHACLDTRTRIFGRDHFLTQHVLRNLARNYWNLGEMDAAEMLFDQVVAGQAAALPEGHPEPAGTALEFAERTYRLGLTDAALARFARAQKMQPPGSEQAARAAIGQALCLADLGRDAEARALLDTHLPTVQPTWSFTVEACLSQARLHASKSRTSKSRTPTSL